MQGVHQDPVTYLLSQLAADFAPLGKEARLAAMKELMSFTKLSRETIDAIISRFRIIRWRAAQGNAGIQISWEGYSWILLKAIGVSGAQLVQILQPVQGHFPNNEQDFEAMCLTLRRMGHILENSPHNLAHALRHPGSASNNFPMFADPAATSMSFPTTQMGGDPWQQHDPWNSGAASSYDPMPEATTPPHHQQQPDPWGT